MTLFFIKELSANHRARPSWTKTLLSSANSQGNPCQTTIIDQKNPISLIRFHRIPEQMVSLYSCSCQPYIYFVMTTTISELYGIDVSDYGVVELNREAFKSIDFDLYPPERTHFLIHAVQFQLPLPTEKNMLKAEKANEIKCKKGEKDQVARPVRGDPRSARLAARTFQRRRISWVVPDKFGPQPVRREDRNGRGRGGRRSRGSLPQGPAPTLSNYLGTIPNMMNWIPNNVPQLNLLPGMLPQVPGVGLGQPVPMLGQMPMIGQPVPIMGQQIPMMGQIPMLGQQIPMNLGQIPPIGLPSPIIPQQQIPLPVFSAVPATIPVQAPRKQKQPRLPKKPQTAAFKVKTPEQIVLKAARRECQQKFQKWREQYKITRQVYATTLETPVPIYFQKKKASQKRRRQEKYQLIKQHKKRLVEIYGTAVFNRGWPITRKEILASLGLTDKNQEPFEEVGTFMEMTASESNDEEIAQEQLPVSLSESDFPEISPTQHQIGSPMQEVQSI